MELESNLMNACQAAYRMACEELRDRTAGDICIHTNAMPVPGRERVLLVQYMNTGYTVDLESGRVEMEGSEEPVSATVKVLILHYLLNARVRPMSGRLISFKEIPGGGAIYYQTFYKRAITPLVKVFANNIEGFYKAAEKIGGKRDCYGHASVTLQIFPLVPVTYVLWQGDEEFPASGTILFDETVTSFLPGEDIVLAASFGVYAMMEELRREER